VHFFIRGKRPRRQILSIARSYLLVMKEGLIKSADAGFLEANTLRKSI
jgi:hypothetical protein